jgi:hypothetical protein
VWLNVIGWSATAVFSSSYFFKEAATLRRIQAAAASRWCYTEWRSIRHRWSSPT